MRRFGYRSGFMNAVRILTLLSLTALMLSKSAGPDFSTAHVSAACMHPNAIPDGLSAKQSIEQLIRHLSSEEFAVRQAAATELTQRTEAFVPLHHAQHSPDAEVRRLAADCIDKLRETLKRKALDSLKNLAKNGEVDLFIDRFVALRSDLRAEDWQTGLDLARNLVERARRATKKDVTFPDFPFMTFSIIHPDYVPSGFGERRVAATGFPFGQAPGDDISRSFAVCQEKVVMHHVISNSIVFTMGSILVVDDANQANIRGSVVFSDGDVKTDNIYNSIVIASGNVKVNETVAESVVIQKDRSPLSFVKPFTLEKAGVAVKPVDGRLEVTQVAEGKPFARAGLRTGDLLLSVDKEKPKTAEEFRKLVRRNTVPFKVTTFLISRKGERLNLLVHLDL